MDKTTGRFGQEKCDEMTKSNKFWVWSPRHDSCEMYKNSLFNGEDAPGIICDLF
jgi:hypothetical protein